MHVLWSRIHFKLISLEFALTILIAERIERCTVEKVFKEKREQEREREREKEREREREKDFFTRSFNHQGSSISYININFYGGVFFFNFMPVFQCLVSA